MKKICLSFPALMFLSVLLSSFAIIWGCSEDEAREEPLLIFKEVAPAGWECSIITEDFWDFQFPRFADTPVAVIVYKNPAREFNDWSGRKINPWLFLDLYPINQKEELIELIIWSSIFSSNIPIYFGETKDYFIITGTLLYNGGAHSAEAEASMNDLLVALRKIIRVNKDYGLHSFLDP